MGLAMVRWANGTQVALRLRKQDPGALSYKSSVYSALVTTCLKLDPKLSSDVTGSES